MILLNENPYGIGFVVGVMILLNENPYGICRVPRCVETRVNVSSADGVMEFHADDADYSDDADFSFHRG